MLPLALSINCVVVSINCESQKINTKIMSFSLQVSLQHHEGITANTEFEYLKNIMFQVSNITVQCGSALLFSVSIFNKSFYFQYLTNNINSNGCTLVKVIAAVLKFSPQQTQVVLEREAQRKTLVS